MLPIDEEYHPAILHLLINIMIVITAERTYVEEEDAMADELPVSS